MLIKKTLIMKNLTSLKIFLTLIMIGFAYFAIAQSTTSYGASAGTGGSNSAYFGYQAGQSAASYICCSTFIGAKAGKDNTTGMGNTFLGQSAGERNGAGGYNTYLGLYTGQLNQTGYRNTLIGAYAGGAFTSGSDNVFIGYSARVAGSNKLAISNNSSTPLIYGDFASDQVGINTTDVPAGYALAIRGKTITEEVKIRTYYNWPDYVFAPDYHLSPLSTLEEDIQTLGHLPGVPSAEEVKEDGFHLGEMDAILLEKVEELTLYLIEMNKKVEKLEAENEHLKSGLGQIKN